ncbi:MAG: FAD-binding protein [Eggerthellaceae bacterium]
MATASNERGAFSRRSFMKGALVTAAVAGMGVVGTACAPAAETGAGDSPASSADGSDAAYQNIYQDGVNLMPARKEACPGPRGPVAYEAREIPASDIQHEEDFDVVVVGAGVGGLMAGLKAADMGAKVLILEKMTKGRGCFECFGAVGASCQEGTEIDKAALLDEIYRRRTARAPSLRAPTSTARRGDGPPAEDIDKGANGFVITKVERGPVRVPAMTPLIDTELGLRFARASRRGRQPGHHVCLEMQDVAKNAYDTVDPRFSTPAGSWWPTIPAPDGRRRATSPATSRRTAKGVIMATGGYDCNPEMMQAWTRPEDYAHSSWWNPGWGTTGDGHMMGLAIGAQMDPVPHPVMNFRWGTPDSFADFRTWNAVYFGILVNGRGNRFVREDAPFQVVSNAQNAQPGYGKNCWYIFDETMYEGMEDALDEFKQKGWLFEAPTAKELAEAAGIDADGLAATLERYASFFQAGRDADSTATLRSRCPSRTRACSRSPRTATSRHHRRTVHDGTAVLDTNDEPIPGLRLRKRKRQLLGELPAPHPRTSIGRAITFGHTAAENAVNGVIGVGPKLDGNAPELTAYAEGPAWTRRGRPFENLGP